MMSVGVIFIFKKSQHMKIWNFPVQVQTSQLSRLLYSPVVDPANLPKKSSNWPNGTSGDVRADLCDWRTPLLAYLRDSSGKVDKSVRRSAFKYVLHNDEPYRRTAEDLLLKFLGSDQARVAWEKFMKAFVVRINWPQR
jgi:hypothetical protein